MKPIRLLLFILGIALSNFCCAEESSDIRLTAECEPIATVADCVNVISGDYFEAHTDIRFNDSDSWALSRYYDSGHLVSQSFLGFGFGSNFPFEAKEPKTKNKHSDAWVEEREGCRIPYRSSEGILSSYKVDKRILKKGYTNLSKPGLKSQVNIANMKGEFSKEGWKIKSGNGSERFYGKYKSIASLDNNEQTSYYDLRQEILPNGNRILFCYTDADGMHWPSKIALADSSGKVILSELVFQYTKDLVRVSNNRGDSVAYLKSKEKRKSTINGNSTWTTAFFLTDVHSPQHTPIKYRLADNNDSGAFCIGKVEKIDGRYLKIAYNDQCKVKALAGPLGSQGQEMIFQRFFYKKQHTQVLDALDQLTIYRFCSDKRLTAIGYYEVKNGKQPKIGKEGAKEENFNLLKEERFSWKTEDGKEGWLTSKAIVDGAGNNLQKSLYRYDNQGNCIKEIWKGNLTGRGPDAFTEKDELASNNVESYEKGYKYSGDGFNLLLEESTPEGLTTRYAYAPNTNLLIGKFVLYDGKIQERTFHYYHSYGVLIQTIEDDGSSENDFDLTDVTVRRVKKIEADLQPRSPSFGKPLVIQESYQNHHTGGHLVNLKTVRLTYSPRGIVSCEKIYDAEDQFRYQVLTEHDEKDRLILKVDQLGQQTRYAYDHNDNKTEEELIGSGKKTNYVYDVANRLIQKREVHKKGAGETTFDSFYTYDALNHLVSEKDAFGNVTTYTYDRLGRQTGCIKPAVLDLNGHLISPTVKKVYNLLNQLIEETDENGHTTKTRYTVYGKPTYLEHPDGTAERFEYYPNGSLKQVWQTDGTSSHYTYNPRGLVIKEETFDAAGTALLRQSYAYKGSLLQSSTDAMGVLTSYFYDGAGRKIREICLDHHITYHYDALGRPQKVIRHGEGGQQRIECTSYDHLDRIVLKQQVDEHGEMYGKEESRYDIQGNCIYHAVYQQHNQPASEESEFYPWGALARKKDALGQLTEYTYDFTHRNVLNQKVLKKTMKEPSGRQIIEVEDACHRLVQQESYHPHLIALTQFTYDGKGNLILQREAVINKGAIESYYTIERSYNSLDLLEKIVEKPALKTTCYQYDLRGRLSAKIKPDGVLLSYLYSPLGHLIELTASDYSVSYTYHYDVLGHLLEINDTIHNKQQTRSYDLLGRLVEENLGNQLALRYSYDPFDRIKSLTLPDDSSIRYSYNAFHLTQVERLSKKQKSLYVCPIPQYDWCGRMLSRQLPFGKIRYAFDLLGRPLSIQGPHWSQKIHSYDVSGNLLSQSIQDADGKWTEQFGYDSLNQLVSEKGILTNDYCYDSLHNRREHNKQVNEINSLNQLVKDAESGYVYDANGNLVEQTNPDTQYHYDGLDRLSTLITDGQATHFIYDGLGRCLEMSDQESHRCLLYQGEQEIGSWEKREIKELGIVHSESMLHPMLAIELDGKPFIPIQDHRRNLCCLLDWKGSLIESHRYSAFGLTTPTLKKARTPWQFSGKRSVGHLVYFGQRFYSPKMGKWLNADPSGFEDGSNLYAYVHNNPLMHLDLFGLFDLDLTGKSFFERMQALDFESFAAQAEYSPAYFSAYSAQGMRQGLWNAYGSPVETAGNQYNRAIDIANGDFNKQFEGLSPQEYSRQLGLLTGEAIGTGLQLASAGYSLGRGIAAAGVNATKLFWNKAVARTATQGLATSTAKLSTRLAVAGESHITNKVSNVVQKTWLPKPLEGTRYTAKVLKQMRLNSRTALPDFHAFPRIVDNYAHLGGKELIFGKDGIIRTKISLPGVYQRKEGYFEWIIESDKTINHRLFVPN